MKNPNEKIFYFSIRDIFRALKSHTKTHSCALLYGRDKRIDLPETGLNFRHSGKRIYIIFFGSTHSVNCSSVSRPSSRAACRRVMFSLCAFFAILAALS